MLERAESSPAIREFEKAWTSYKRDLGLLDSAI